MKNLKYSKEEEKVFRDTLATIIDDLEAIWKLGAVDNLVIPVYLPGFNDCNSSYNSSQWTFRLEQKGFYLYQGNPKEYNSYWFARRNKLGKLVKLLSISDQDIIFINNYPEIKEKIMDSINLAIKEKDQNLEIANKLKQMLQREATIEIELPETINQHRLEVVEEDGRKIGTLNFGNLSLRIITSGNVELVNKTIPEVKSKRK